ncbi:N-acetyl-gamma-glutamyl-phosphate reductase [Dysosmobacter sp.]|uniref:N-acetyl-gamma-glutamyl-phosphate reductase n=1 Tax=Dysosmobacter sp. TaxID=2591382 RepID=UPI003D8F6F76
MKPKVYIDGKDGTTGLQIYERLSAREDITLLLIDEAKRKDPAERAKLMNQADLVFLCLPDAAAREAVTLIDNPATRVIDASTAHRTAPGWVYGFAELKAGQREAIAGAKRVANPGCHATGFLSLAAPLVALGLLPRDAALTCFSLTGYSGGGKKMIAQYEAADRETALSSPAPYALGQTHKHLPEMKAVAGLDTAPVFIPIVDDYYKGMSTTIPLHMSQLRGVGSVEALRRAYADYYAGQTLVTVAPEAPGKVYANAMAGRDALTVLVDGTDEAVTLTALFDNLGKGASGAAVQNMNLMLGLAETAGLKL